MAAAPPRRVVALVLPLLACELVRQRATSAPPKAGRARAAPLAVIIERPGDDPKRSELDVVDDEARACGVRPGQQATEAAALVSRLVVQRVTEAEIVTALGRVAEVALAFGTTAAIELDDESPCDTVWIDISGSAHLVGGEEALLELLAERVHVLGHRVRLAVADGPRLAQAIARWAPPAAAGNIAPAGGGQRAMDPLPVHALPIDRDVASFLVRVGVMTIGDLVRLPREAAHARLGRGATMALDLALGRDAAPLLAFAPPRVLVEEVSFEEGVTSSEGLLFVARGIIARLVARLAARGEACGRLEVAIGYDRSIAALRLHGTAHPDEPGGSAVAASDEARLDFHIDLPAPLAGESDLFRALKAKLERTPLLAPAVSLRIVIPHIARARCVQLDLSRERAASPDAIPTLLAELSAEIGADHIGVLEVVAAHRPEARSRLVPADPLGDDEPSSDAARPDPSSDGMPTRLLSRPVSLGHARRGAVVAIAERLYAVDTLRFVMRLDAVEWWLDPVSRDYLRAELSSPAGSTEAFVFVDRKTGETFLQGWYE